MNIEITEQARKALIENGVTDGQYFRISVVSGGCSGMTYRANIDITRTDNDVVLYEDERVTVIADFNSALYLNGLNIDYSDDLIRAGFRLSNPNANKACGCGGSFQA